MLVELSCSCAARDWRTKACPAAPYKARSACVLYPPKKKREEIVVLESILSSNLEELVLLAMKKENLRRHLKRQEYINGRKITQEK